MRDLLHGYLQWKSNMKHFKDNVVTKAPVSLASSMASSGNECVVGRIRINSTHI